MSFQENLIKFRKEKSPSAKAFAQNAGISYTTYHNYEKGAWPSEENLIKIAAALHVSIDDLLGYKVDKLAYWLEKFPNGGLFAERVGENKIRLFMNVGEPNEEGEFEVWTTLTVRIMPNDKFIAEMEEIAKEAESETNYELIFNLSVIQHFLKPIGEMMNEQRKAGIEENTTTGTKKSPADESAGK